MSDDYERGHTAARMSNYDRHFERLNGSMDRNAAAIESLTLAVQQLRDQHEADARTRVSTAQALKEAAEALSARSERRWSPVARISTVIGALVGLVGVFLAVYANAH